MVKVIIDNPLSGVPKRVRKAGRADLPSRRVRDESGKLVTRYVLDANSDTLVDDMLTLFKRNVSRARRDHRERLKTLGVAAE